MGEMVTYTLAELAGEIVDNRGRTCPTASAGTPLIATNCLKTNHRYPVFENVRFVDDETYKTWFRAHPRAGDILFVTKGSPGRVAVVPDPVPFCIAQDMVALRGQRRIVDPAYLYYRLMCVDVRGGIEGMHVGTLIPHFKKGDFDKLAIPVHSELAEQRAIADVLSAIDNKIGANRRVVEAANALITNIVRLLETRATVAELARHARSSTNPNSYKCVSHYSLPAFDAGETPLVERGVDIKSSKFLLSRPSVLFSKLNPRFSRVWDIRQVPPGTALASTEFVVLEPLGVTTSELRATLALPEVSSTLAARAAGTSGSHQRVKPDEILRLEVRDPRALSTVQRELVESASSVIEQTRKESEALARTRDELLPLLMTGKLTVKGAKATVADL